MEIKELIEKNKLEIEKEKILFNEPMKKYSTFKIGGLAECLIKIDNIDDLKKVLKFSKENNIKITIIGNGSNVLILDGGIKGITMLIKIENYQINEAAQNEIEVIAGAGCKIGKLAQVFLKNEITGFEELSGIPGTLGGAVKMNAGAHGKEFVDIIEEVKVIDYNGKEKTIKKEECEFSYRNSIFKHENYIITEVKMKLEKGNETNIKNKMTEYLKYRKEKQPIEYPSAGSTFKRGNDFITAKLIDLAGLKGFSIGDAQISCKHSGFIINKGNATAKDVLELVKHVEKTIEKEFNKKIELEIEIIGEN